MRKNNKDLEIMFENSDGRTCKICHKPSQLNFYGACCDEHRKLNCRIFMNSCKRIMSKLPKVELTY